MTGAMAATRSASDQASNDAQNGSRVSGSRIPAVRERRKPGFVRSSGSMTSEASGRWAKVSRPA